MPVKEISDIGTNIDENISNLSRPKDSTIEITKYTNFEKLPIVTEGEKDQNLHRCSEPPEPLKPLLKQISELKPMSSTESLTQRYSRIVAVVSLYW